MFLAAIDNERRVVTLVLFFVVIVAAFGLFAVVGALVREKVRELGVLAALGFSPLRRAALVGSIGGLGALAGSLLGLGAARLIVANRAVVERFLEERLADYKVPREYAVIPELPRNALGKVLKRVLREQEQSL